MVQIAYDLALCIRIQLAQNICPERWGSGEMDLHQLVGDVSNIFLFQLQRAFELNRSVVTMA